jgi:hypothetical protein
MAIPSLSRWTLTSQPTPTTVTVPQALPMGTVIVPAQSPPAADRYTWRRSCSRSRSYSPARDYSPSRRYEARRSRAYSPEPTMGYPPANVTSNQNGISNGITASFAVPGKMTIPSDNASHKVTIAHIPAEADLEWVCVPKRDARVYLKVSSPCMLACSTSLTLCLTGKSQE